MQSGHILPSLDSIPRRRFLGGAALFYLGARLGTDPDTQAEPRATTPKYRVGLIGCGRKGTQFARCYSMNPRSEVVAGADIDPKNLALFCERFKVKGYSDYREMLRNERIDIAAPILPVKPNPAVVIGCAESGSGLKAIFCEKPMATSLEEADRMVEACRSHGILLAAGDMYRNYPQIWAARGMIDSGELGPVQSMNLYQSTDEISGGGCQGLSVMRMFAQDAEVEWVTGWVKGNAQSDDDQGMGGYVRFTNGIECFIHCKRSAKQGFEVLCTKGMFFTDWTSFRVWKSSKGEAAVRLADLKEVSGLLADSVPYGAYYDAEGWIYPGDRNIASVQSIVDALEKRTEPRSSGDNGRKVLEVAIALRESHRRNHAPVRLPLQDRSLKIIPVKGRLLNKKDVMGEVWYEDQIQQLKKPKS